MPPCPKTESGLIGQTLTVTNSFATFSVGHWPKGMEDQNLKPDKLSGKVDPAGNLELSRGKIGVTSGHFDGPADGNAGHENKFRGTLVIVINKQVSCGYSVYLIHAPQVGP
jgi:hypothetical protein